MADSETPHIATLDGEPSEYQSYTHYPHSDRAFDRPNFPAAEYNYEDRDNAPLVKLENTSDGEADQLRRSDSSRSPPSSAYPVDSPDPAHQRRMSGDNGPSSPAAPANNHPSLAPSSSNLSVNTSVRSAVSALSSAPGSGGAPGGPKRFRPAPAKTFQCRGYGDCRMVFSRSEHLARHIRKHTGERPFTCHCGKQFSRLDNLRQHAQTVHADKADENDRMMRDLTTLHATMASAHKVGGRRKGPKARGGASNLLGSDGGHPSRADAHQQNQPGGSASSNDMDQDMDSMELVKREDMVDMHPNAEMQLVNDVDMEFDPRLRHPRQQELLQQQQQQQRELASRNNPHAHQNSSGRADMTRMRPGTSTGYEGGYEEEYSREYEPAYDSKGYENPAWQAGPGHSFRGSSSSFRDGAGSSAQSSSFREGARERGSSLSTQHSFRPSQPFLDPGESSLREHGVSNSQQLRESSRQSSGPLRGEQHDIRRTSSFRDVDRQSSVRGAKPNNRPVVRPRGQSFRSASSSVAQAQHARPATANVGSARPTTSGGRPGSSFGLTAANSTFSFSVPSGRGFARDVERPTTSGRPSTSTGRPPTSTGRPPTSSGRTNGGRPPTSSGTRPGTSSGEGRSFIASRPGTSSGPTLPPISSLIASSVASQPPRAQREQYILPLPAFTFGRSRPDTAPASFFTGAGRGPSASGLPAAYFSSTSKPAYGGSGVGPMDYDDERPAGVHSGGQYDGGSNDSPFSFHPPDASSVTPPPANNTRKRARDEPDDEQPRPGTAEFRFGHVAGEFRPRSSRGGDYDYGSESRPQSRRFSVMELCHESDRDHSAGARVLPVPASSASFGSNARPTTTSGLVSSAAGLALDDRRSPDALFARASSPTAAAASAYERRGASSAAAQQWARSDERDGGGEFASSAGAAAAAGFAGANRVHATFASRRSRTPPPSTATPAVLRSFRAAAGSSSPGPFAYSPSGPAPGRFESPSLSSDVSRSPRSPRYGSIALGSTLGSPIPDSPPAQFGHEPDAFVAAPPRYVHPQSYGGIHESFTLRSGTEQQRERGRGHSQSFGFQSSDVHRSPGELSRESAARAQVRRAGTPQSPVAVGMKV